MAAVATAETYSFSADIAQLMGVIVNTIYSNKEIFLRELISNAADALERAHFEQLKMETDEGSNIADGTGDGCIRIYTDVAARTLTVEDTGVGMTAEELVEHLGTIARSRTKAFLEELANNTHDQQSALIGQFGIGFYSAYVVSERVCVVSRSASSDAQYVWESTAGGSFSLQRDDRLAFGKITRGTKVVCFLKQDHLDFLDTARLKRLMARHSCFVKWPLFLRTERWCQERGEISTFHTWERLDSIKPVWLQAPNTVLEMELVAAYRWLTGDFNTPMAVRHVETSRERQVDFRAMLFCCGAAREDVFDLIEGRTQGSKVSLYARRVFVKEFDDLLPKWMCFVAGVVDGDDLPLNASREQLQRESAVMRHISRSLARECFAMLGELAKSEAEYCAFHDTFGQNLKLGLFSDAEYRVQIVELLRYYTTRSGDRPISLREYVARAQPGQRHIIYITGRSQRHAAESPLVEGFRRDGYEVLLMSDPADEFALQVLTEFEGMELVSATSVHANCQDVRASTPLVEDHRMQVLSGRVERALIRAKRPCNVVLRELGAGGSPLPVALLVREGKLVDGRNGSGVETEQSCPVETFELNASHGLFQELAKRKSVGNELSEAEQVLIVVLHDLASAFLLDKGSQSAEQRRRLAEQLQEMVWRLDGADRDAELEDLPDITAVPDSLDLHSHEVSGGLRGRASSDRSAEPSIGSIVRISGEKRSRRAMVTYVDQESGTIDVLYNFGSQSNANQAHAGNANVEDGVEDGVEEREEDEEEGLPTMLAAPLQDFELAWDPDQTLHNFAANPLAVAHSLKEEGNALFRLRDYEAAAERYSLIIDAVRRPRIQEGQVVLLCVQQQQRQQQQHVARPSLQADVVRLLDPSGTRCELAGGSCHDKEKLYPVLGLSSLRPVLMQLPAFRRLSGPLVEQIAFAAAEPASVHVSLQAAAHTNRSRCFAALGRHRRAAQDCTIALALWRCLEAWQPHDATAREAVLRGCCTVSYLRARARLCRGLTAAAGGDLREALARGPPPTLARHLEQLQAEVVMVATEPRRVREPLARELAKVLFALRSAAL